MQSIELNKTYTFLIEDVSFGSLPEETIREIFLDGRAFSHFIEPWLAIHFPLKHIKGCKEYDHIGLDDPETLYDAKTMTRGGCKFCPSNMLGAGRHFDSAVFIEKAKNWSILSYAMSIFRRYKCDLSEAKNWRQDIRMDRYHCQTGQHSTSKISSPPRHIALVSKSI